MGHRSESQVTGNMLYQNREKASGGVNFEGMVIPTKL